MEEVVVTGMFTRKANSYTGSVTTIKGDELKTVGNGNVLSSLKNIDPSFLMVENLEVGSNPNAIPDFQMRGQTGLPKWPVNIRKIRISRYLFWMDSRRR